MSVKRLIDRHNCQLQDREEEVDESEDSEGQDHCEGDHSGRAQRRQWRPSLRGGQQTPWVKLSSPTLRVTFRWGRTNWLSKLQ